MASANDFSRRKAAQHQNEDKSYLMLDVMELVDDMRNKIDLALQDFLLQYHKIQPQDSSIIVISKQQLELHKKLSMQRIQNKIELEAYQHKQKMKLLAAS